MFFNVAAISDTRLPVETALMSINVLARIKHPHEASARYLTLNHSRHPDVSLIHNLLEFSSFLPKLDQNHQICF